MRIERVVLKNYRQFKNMDIKFNKNAEEDLHLIVGKNGTGKTNFLNAINWCLYGEEPHLSKVSEKLSPINLKYIEDSDKDKNVEVMVRVEASSPNDGNIVYTRSTRYKIYKNESKIMPQDSDFTVSYKDVRGNKKDATNEEAMAYVNRFVPDNIREFFFFDGEQLDKYLIDTTGQKIKHAIFEVSQIQLIERIQDRLQKTLDDLNYEYSKQNPETKELNDELQGKKEELRELEELISKTEEQKDKAKIKYDEYSKRLVGYPDVDSLQKEVSRLKEEIKTKKEEKDKKINQKNKLLLDSGKIIFSWNALCNTLSIIEEKRKNKDLPPPVDRSLLEEIIKNNKCSICGKEVDTLSLAQINLHLNKITLSSNMAKTLQSLESKINILVDRIEKFNTERKNLTDDIAHYDEDLDKIRDRLSQIDRDLSGYEQETVKEWYEEKKKWENIYEDKLKDLGQLCPDKKKLEENIKTLQSQIKEHQDKEEKANKLINQIRFTEKALSIIKETKNEIIEKTRRDMEKETNRLFFGLIWKKGTFREVTIDDRYNIHLIHSLGYECLGSLSAAERELLALSFTLALHKISGFDSPILIDTPVARVSDENRENFAKIFLEVSKIKQTILLFTPAEYSEEIKEHLDCNNSNRFSFIVSKDESETTLEVL